MPKIIEILVIIQVCGLTQKGFVDNIILILIFNLELEYSVVLLSHIYHLAIVIDIRHPEREHIRSTFLQNKILVICRRCLPGYLLLVITVEHCHVQTIFWLNVCHSVPEHMRISSYTKQSVFGTVTIVVHIILAVHSAPYTCVFVSACFFVSTCTYIFVCRCGSFITAITHHVAFCHRRCIELGIVHDDCCVL